MIGNNRSFHDTKSANAEAGTLGAVVRQGNEHLAIWF
jgi:hypothetical protein